VVATVNGKPIMRSDLERYYKASLGDNPPPQSEDQANIDRLSILHNMIEDEILQQRAAKLNLVASDEDVNSKLTEIKAPYTQDQFDAMLKQRNMTLDDYKRYVRRTLTSTKLLNKEIESKINITDAEIAAYYNAHKAEFNLIEPEYHLAWILTTDMPTQQSGNLQGNKAASDADAKKKIETLHNRLDSGEDFGTLAMNFSEDPNTAPNSGDRGFLPESQLKADPVLYAAISKLKPGQYTDVMPVYDGPAPNHHVVGYAIWELIAREPAGQRELNDPGVRQTIHNQLHDSRAQLLRNAYFEMLHDEAKVHNYFADEILKGAQ
jgi:parvulin-like peptidyl-prolyl isomerase